MPARIPFTDGEAMTSVCTTGVSVCRQEGGKLVMRIELSPDEAADYLNFVIKDAATNTWFDANGSNFQLALRNSLRSFMSIDDSEFVRTPR